MPSGPPRNITVWAVSSTSIEISWLPPAEEDQNGVIFGYKLKLTNPSSGETIERIFEQIQNLTVLIPGKLKLEQKQ